MARPTKLTQKITEELPGGVTREISVSDAIVRALRAGAYVEDAAESVGVSKTAVYNWLARGEEHSDQARVPASEKPYVEFLYDVTRARAAAKVWHLGNIRQQAQEDWRASKWFLSVVDPEHYSERHRLEHSGGVAFRPASVDLSKLSDAEAEELEVLLEKAQEGEEA